MAKITVSDQTYNEISQALKKLGREINDGAIISLERGDAIMPPRDFRMVAIRQNCLIAAAEVFKNPHTQENHGGIEFLNIADEIFNWCLNGKDDNSNNSQS